MNDVKITIYEHSNEMPPLPDDNFFHSRRLMELYELTPRMRPLMAVATNGEGQVLGQVLAVLSSRWQWLPPFRFAHARILGEGRYADAEAKPDELFGLIMNELTHLLRPKARYIEVSHLSHKTLGYKQLRRLGFFPVRWMSVQNTLYSRPPEERILSRLKKQIDRAQSHVSTSEISTDDDFRDFMKLLRHHNWLKLRRFVPHEALFRGIMKGTDGQLFVTRYRGRVIGCCAVIYSDSDAYLWYAAARRKSYAPLHPNAVTIWESIKHAHAMGMRHFRFMDVGLPLRRNYFRDFILRFGGKEATTYRWFRVRVRWINSLLSWLYRY